MKTPFPARRNWSAARASDAAREGEPRLRSMVGPDQEGLSLLSPGDGPRDVDLVFATVAHEVAHEWWGVQVVPASVEGAALLTESLAWYSAYQVVEEAYGPEHLRRLSSRMRGPEPIPPQRATVPLLRATGQYLGYRKGPFAMDALSRWISEDRVNDALRRLREAHRSGEPPLATSLDLYRELQAVTPDSLQHLLHDLFEAKHRIHSGEQTITVTVSPKLREGRPALAGVDPYHVLDWVSADNVGRVEVER